MVHEVQPNYSNTSPAAEGAVRTFDNSGSIPFEPPEDLQYVTRIARVVEPGNRLHGEKVVYKIPLANGQVVSLL